MKKIRLEDINDLFSSFDNIVIVDGKRDETIIETDGIGLDDIAEVPQEIQNMEIILIKSTYARNNNDIEIVVR